ncbi:LysR family transcriptional regulator [Puniceibacterium sediminis]|uniref:Transcriptional regulator, LysR family n=1 Tax=Puniceibacterium sediminis TaxID=1608407 RepID=A0A238ZN99_9RHOB|nr:LysR family transcriptional regulator [Puniceibacterium sediminis]SNR84639.1 transcriptional regulator, LysR family [Puniceibacterium sediminis]
MSLTYNQLVAMLAVVDSGTFERAASRLHLTQSTITKRIQELEASMGFLVFDRSKRQAILTPQGEQFVSQARETVASFDNLASFTSEGRAIATLVRLGVTELSSLTWLPRFLEASFAAGPDVQFELTIDMSRNLHSSLETGELDLIVVPEMPFQSNAHVQPIADVEITLIGKPGLVPSGKILEISDLQDFNFITQGRTSGFSKSISEWFANYGINTRHSVRVDSLHAMVGLAVAGRGLCITPREYLVPLINSGRVTELLTRPRLPLLKYCVVHYPSPHEALFSRVASDIRRAVDFKKPYFT